MTEQIIEPVTDGHWDKTGTIGQIEPRQDGWGSGDCKLSSRMVPEVGIEPTRGVNPTGF